ncbi:MAG: response regulator [Pseudomonadales bacterium]
MHALIIDDEPLLLEIWLGLFDLLNWPVTTVEGGHAAVELLRKNTYDIVITDLKMRDGDGFLVLDYLQSMAQPPISIVCSGYIDDEKTILDAYKIERIIRKPFSLDAELEYFQTLVR